MLQDVGAEYEIKALPAIQFFQRDNTVADIILVFPEIEDKSLFVTQPWVGQGYAIPTAIIENRGTAQCQNDRTVELLPECIVAQGFGRRPELLCRLACRFVVFGGVSALRVVKQVKFIFGIGWVLEKKRTGRTAKDRSDDMFSVETIQQKLVFGIIHVKGLCLFV